MAGTTTIFLNNPSHSKSYIKFIRDIGESKTKHEEDRIVSNEVDFLKLKLASPELTLKERRECLIRSIYCEMLGHDMSWSYIHAVKFTQSHHIVDKRIGYMAVSLLLHENHELIMLLINTLQKDLKSSNPMEIAMALTVICRLIGPEMIPPLLPAVQEKLLHPKEMVRKKAVMAMHHFYVKMPSSVAHLDDDFRRCLGDQDPGVMEAALNLFYQLVKDQSAKYKILIPTFLDILRSTLQRKLPKEMEYHGLPAPWIQMRLLQILGILGTDDSETSAQMYPVLQDTLNCSACTSSIGQSITYEVIRTITSIYYNSSLIDRAAGAVSRFLAAQNNDWKYAGINALTLVAQVKPEVAQQYQMTVIDCLDDPDDILRRKTLSLLYQMTNPTNVEVITERMLSYLRTTHEDFVKKDIVSKITKLAEKFSPNNIWFMKTMNEVFELEGNLVRQDVGHNLMRLIAEGSEDDDLDDQLRRDAAQSYSELLRKPKLSDVLVRQIAWILGEYSYVLEDEDQEEILEKMCGLLGRSFNTPETRAWIVSAITKMASRMEHLPDFVLNSIATFLASEDHDIQQRCLELCALSENTQLMKEVLPLDASCEDLEVDHSLSFLDEYVADALQKGSAPYVPAYLREEAPKRKSVQKTAVEGFRFEPYAPPPVVTNPSILASATSTQPTSPIALTVEPIAESTTATAKLESEEYTQPMTAGIDVKKPVWGKGGFIKKKTQTVPIEYREDYDGTRSYGNQEVNSDSNSASVESGNVDGKTPESRGEPPTSPAVELSEEERKKQVLAQALFGGGGGFGKAGALSGPGRAPKSKRKQLVTSPTVPKESTAPITHSPKPTKPPPKQSDVDLLLDLGDLSFDGSGQSSVTNGSSLTTEPVQAPKMDGLFAGLQNSSSSSFGSTGQAAPLEQSSLLDTKQPPSNQDQLGVLGLLGENPGISLPGDLEACPHTNSEDLCQDGLVRVSAVKVYKPSELVVVLSFTSMRQKDTSISLSLSLPSNCQCSVDGAAVSLSPASTTVGMVVSAFGTVQKMIILTPQGPSPQMSIHGDLTYKEDIVGKKQFFDYQVQTVDMLRPQQMVTKEFGKNWGTLVHKKREKIPSSRITTPKEFHEFVQKMFRFHPIEIIGKEAIAAAVFLPSSLCLLHCKVLQSSSTLELSVLSNNSLLTNCVGKEITAALSE